MLYSDIKYMQDYDNLIRNTPSDAERFKLWSKYIYDYSHSPSRNNEHCIRLTKQAFQDLIKSKYDLSEQAATEIIICRSLISNNPLTKLENLIKKYKILEKSQKLIILLADLYERENQPEKSEKIIKNYIQNNPNTVSSLLKSKYEHIKSKMHSFAEPKPKTVKRKCDFKEGDTACKFSKQTAFIITHKEHKYFKPNTKCNPHDNWTYMLKGRQFDESISAEENLALFYEREVEVKPPKKSYKKSMLICNESMELCRKASNESLDSNMYDLNNPKENVYMPQIFRMDTANQKTLYVEDSADSELFN